MKFRYKMQTQLIFSYIILTVLVVTFIGIMLNFSITQGFKQYVISKNEDKVETLIHNLEYSYLTSHAFNLDDITHLGVEAIESGFIIQIHDMDKSLIWSATEHNSGLCKTMLTNVRDSMFDHNSNWNGQYAEKEYELKNNDESYAILTIGYMGPYYFNDEELFFLSRINTVIIWVAILAIVLSILVGILNTTSITSPIKRIVEFQNLMLREKTNLLPVYDRGVDELHSLYESTLLLEQRINRQETLRKQLTQDMAHELKTPLTSLQGTLEALIDGIFPLEIERLVSCHEEIIRIKKLVNEVENLANIENNNLKLRYSKVNVIDLVQSLANSFQIQFNENNFAYQVNINENSKERLLRSFPCDESKLKQVLINLIDNSIKYAGYKSKITIDLAILGDNKLSIRYSDDGVGISQADQELIFERFYRSDPSRTGNNGLGIGLTLVKSIIEQHNGTISIISTEKQGLAFGILIPFHKE